MIHEIDVVGRELLNDLLAVADGKLDRHFRVGGPESRQKRRGEVFRGTHRSQLQHAALQARIAASDSPASRSSSIAWSVIAQQLGAGGGQVHLATDLLEQGKADFLLQELHLLRHSRLRQVQFAGGPR